MGLDSAVGTWERPAWNNAMRALVTALVLLAVLPASASAGRMPQPPRVVVHHVQNPECFDDQGVPAPCAGGFEAWLPPGAGRYARSHEMGHLWFDQVPTPERRAWFDRQLERTGDDPPNELAAEAYATCDLGYSPAPRRRPDGALVVNWPVAYDYYPTARQHRRLCNAIAVVALVHAYGSGTTR